MAVNLLWKIETSTIPNSDWVAPRKIWFAPPGKLSCSCIPWERKARFSSRTVIGKAKNDFLGGWDGDADPHAPSRGTARASVSARLRVPTGQSLCTDQGVFASAG